MRLALKLGYDGRRFHGYSRQPGQRTVEGDILRALGDLGVLPDGTPPRRIGLASASRTDAGVSALGNVLALDTDFRKDALLPALNARLEDIWFHSMAEVPDGFRPRDASLRWYRYHLRSEEVKSPPVLGKALGLFRGTHDFSNFCRPEGKDATRTVDEVRIHKGGPFIAVDIIARSFLWNQVRRMMGAALAAASGEIALRAVETALKRSSERTDLGLAPPEGLFLMDVAYDHIIFKPDRKAVGLARRQLDRKMREAEGTLMLASCFPATGRWP